jgi:outer membrane protein TolC
LPQDLPVSLPSKLVDQRPDVRSAEAQLHAASAEIGVATAALLPQFTLTANAGTASKPDEPVHYDTRHRILDSGRQCRANCL